MVVHGAQFSPSGQSWLLTELGSGESFVLDFPYCGGHDDRFDDEFWDDDLVPDDCDNEDVRVTVMSISGNTATVRLDKP